MLRVTLREVHVKPLPTAPSPAERSMSYDAGTIAQLPIRAGKEETSVTVQIVWSFA